MAIIEEQLLAMITTGFTHYVDIGKESDAAIYYATATEVHMLLPSGSLMHGEWNVNPTGYFVKWRDGPEGNWQIQSDVGKLTYIDPTGKPAGQVTKIVPGNAASF